jgi:hypothetical protein
MLAGSIIYNWNEAGAVLPRGIAILLDLLAPFPRRRDAAGAR